MQEAADKGRALWPEAAIALDTFTAHLRACGADAEGVAQHGADLYLAAACAAGDPAALRWFDRQLLPTIDRVLARTGMADARDELRQQLRVKLLTGERTILRYAGRSSLVTWLRSVVQYTIVNQQRARATERRQMERYSLDHILVARPDPEVEAIKHRYGSTSRARWRRAWRRCRPGPRRSCACITWSVSTSKASPPSRASTGATVARWLTGIRAVALSNLRSRLATTVRPTSSAFRSLVTVMRDELELDVTALLEDPARTTR